MAKVLIIDDEEGLRHTLMRILTHNNCEVGAAADGEAALDALAEGGFDLVFLDLRLPNMDGLEVLRRIKASDPGLPVVMLTAYGSLQSAVEALRLGATDYLLKPVDPEVLVARTRVILRERTIEKRKGELRGQIAALQEELRLLEAESTPSDGRERPAPAPSDRFMKRGSLILDLQAERATFGENVLSLPPTTFQYLLVLVQRAPQVIPYQALVAEAQDYDTELYEARELAKYHIHVLRQALEPDPKQPQHLLNVRGVGYRWVV
ncbi:MAG TPA: response regulator transcription factor [Anaerolineales bacterium]|nr:response regulator transcription factor [Anaerolineales bacterium]